MKSEFRPARQTVPLRINKSDYIKCRILLEEDGISFQKMMETLFLAYVSDKKKVREIVKAATGTPEVDNRKNKRNLSELETHELQTLLETQVSPLRFLEEAKKEVMEEDSDDDEEDYYDK